jgi:SAM-dependent methyltransferase
MSIALTDKLRELNAYSRLPARLAELHPEISEITKDDIFGVGERLAAICEVLAGRDLGRIVDLGGNSGFFSLSLVDYGMASHSVIYDLNPRALAAGRIMAKELGLDAKVEFVEQPVDLDFVRSLRSADTVICLNLLHHAGSKFDKKQVAHGGWEPYAQEWLRLLRDKFRLAIFGIGLKPAKPRGWNIAPGARARRMCELAERAGWSVMYEANVEDLETFGTAKAMGLRTKRHLLSELASRLFPHRASSTATGSKKSRYHFYIFE